MDGATVIRDYHLIRCETPRDLTVAVRTALLGGWELQGGPSVTVEKYVRGISSDGTGSTLWLADEIVWVQAVVRRA